MTIQRDSRRGPFVIHCDAAKSPQCPGEEEMDESLSFQETVQWAKDNGWRVRQHLSDWFHFCPHCTKWQKDRAFDALKKELE